MRGTQGALVGRCRPRTTDAPTGSPPAADAVASREATTAAGDLPYAAPEGFDVVAHLTTDGATTYRRILAAFVTAKERFHVRPRQDDVGANMNSDRVPASRSTS